MQLSLNAPFENWSESDRVIIIIIIIIIIITIIYLYE